MDKDSTVCVGLFGTCGGSTWRDDFIKEIDNLEDDTTYFNPDAGDNWHPGMIDDENRHLMEDEIILFPVLGETAGTGSLGEIGFSVLNVMRNVMNGKAQFLIILIDDVCTVDDEALAKDSNRARKLVKSKVLKVNHPNIFLVDTLQDMGELTGELLIMALLQKDIDLQYRSA